MTAKRVRVKLKKLTAHIGGDRSNNAIFVRFEPVDLVTLEIMEDAGDLVVRIIQDETFLIPRVRDRKQSSRKSGRRDHAKSSLAVDKDGFRRRLNRDWRRHDGQTASREKQRGQRVERHNRGEVRKE